MIYIYILKIITNIEQYLNSLKNLINDNNQKIITDEYYEYKMENWDKIKHDKIVKYIYPNFNKL